MFVNLTPHVITLVDDHGNIIASIEPEAQPARCEVTRVVAFSAGGHPVNRTVFGSVYNLPDPVDGVWYITSRIVAEAVTRKDVLVPDETVRDKDGKIVGCKSFATLV